MLIILKRVLINMDSSVQASNKIKTVVFCTVDFVVEHIFGVKPAKLLCYKSVTNSKPAKKCCRVLRIYYFANFKPSN